MKILVNIKFFFITCSFFTLFVCLDIFYQFKFGVDIFGYETIEGLRKLGGPFGDEYIAGGYIQRYFLFSFFLIPLYFKNQKKTVIHSRPSPLFVNLRNAVSVVYGDGDAWRHRSDGDGGHAYQPSHQAAVDGGCSDLFKHW